MTRILSTILFFLPVSLAYALTSSEAPPPVEETVGPMGTVIFAILFFGLCAAFVWMIWRNEKKQKQQPK